MTRPPLPRPGRVTVIEPGQDRSGGKGHWLKLTAYERHWLLRELTYPGRVHSTERDSILEKLREIVK